MPSVRPPRRQALFAAAALLASLAVVVPAGAEAPVDGQIVAGPGGFVFPGNYATPAAATVAGGGVQFTNGDIALHDVRAKQLGSDGKPLFSSRLVGVGVTTPVDGVESLAPGTYEYYCTLHPWMVGTLAVVADPLAPGEPAGPAQDWPMYGGDLANSRSREAGPALTDLPGLRRAWTYVSSGEGDFPGTPVVADGTVFVVSSLGIVVGIDLDSGQVRWRADLNREGELAKATASVAYHDGMVYVPVSARRGSAYTPFVAAVDAATGEERWRTYVDTEQDLGDLYSSPVVWSGVRDGEPFSLLYIGTSSWDSGGSGRQELHLGTVVALDLLDGGRVAWRTYMFEGGPHTKSEVPKTPGGLTYNGAAVWSTPAVDTHAGTVYAGTGNGYTTAHSLTGSIVKLDAFSGELLDHYQATKTDPWTLTRANEGVDADFGASPQLVTGPNGERWVGAGQKNMHVVEEVTGQPEPHAMVGLTRYHMIDRDRMEPVWVTPVGPGYWWGGITGSTAWDGNRIYGGTVYGQLWALEADGTPAWITSSQDAVVHMAPTQVANGIVWTMDGKGFLSAYDALTGAPLWRDPIFADAPTAAGPSAGGVAIAGDTVVGALGLTQGSGVVAAYTSAG